MLQTLLALLAAASLQGAPPTPIHLAAGSVIVAEGDSLTYGEDNVSSDSRPPTGGSKERQSAMPYPEALAQFLCGRVSVLNEGFPGDRSLEGLYRWKPQPSASLVVIMYGDNDDAFFSADHATRISPSTYADNLTRLARREMAHGAAVLILAPPPVRLPAFEAELASYRSAAATAASAVGAGFIDPDQLFRGWGDIWTDGLHLKPEAYRQIAAAVAARITVDGCAPIATS